MLSNVKRKSQLNPVDPFPVPELTRYCYAMLFICVVHPIISASKKAFICCLSVLAIPLLYAQPTTEQRAVISIEKIWDRPAHSAFTDLIWSGEAFYCTFREGSGHIPGLNGTIRVIRSQDGQNWESVALLDEYNVDLRDPKISQLPDGRLWLTLGGSYYEGSKLIRREPGYSVSDRDGRHFSAPVPVSISEAIRTPDDWLWRITWQGETAYGVLYQAREGDWGIHLMRTHDGIHYEPVTAWGIDGKPNETTLRFLPDSTMLALVRREGADTHGLLGRSRPPYLEWNWQPLDIRLGGPNFLPLPDGRLLCATRDYFSGEQRKTVLGFLTENGHFDHRLTLPSGGDTSYAGMVLRDDVLYVSYYSNHEEKTAIYLAKIRWREL
jgi:hypothetical protein